MGLFRHINQVLTMINKIKASDLRAGNWVNLNMKHPMQIYGVWSGSVYNKNGERISIEHVSPIELTPELFIKIGFNYKNNTSSVAILAIDYIDSDYPCTLQSSGSGICIARSGIGAITVPIFHLHQLQNLYHALTGHDLTINF